MSNKTYGRAKGRSGADPFVKLMIEMLESPAWRDLSPRARDIFIRLTAKYNGRNNGNLSLTLAELRDEGELKSPVSLRKALDELWRHGFIQLTREGSFGSQRTCNLWALTTWPVNDDRKRDIKGTGFASDHWRHWQSGQDAPDYRSKFPKVKAKRQLCKNQRLHSDESAGTGQ